MTVQRFSVLERRHTPDFGGAGGTKRALRHLRGTSITVASGGKRSTSDHAFPCASTASAASAALPTPLPPKRASSVLRTSAYVPGRGTPRRYASRTTGVKLLTAT